jgi:hypothetical protein
VYNGFQQFLDFAPVFHPFRLSATHLIVKLADKSGKLPPSLYVENIVRDQDPNFHRQGGYADVYRGLRAGDLVAIKKPRILGVTDMPVAHKACFCFLSIFFLK